jgi:hypothetical protein
MHKQYKILEASPFPPDFRGDKVYGSFCEEDLSLAGKYRYTVIYPRPFKYESIDSLRLQGVNVYEAYPWMRQAMSPPQENCFWIYELQRFVIGKEFLTDSTEVSDNATDYCQFVFCDFNELLEYCHTEFAIEFGQFKKKWETHYPQS